MPSSVMAGAPRTGLKFLTVSLRSHCRTDSLYANNMNRRKPVQTDGDFTGGNKQSGLYLKAAVWISCSTHALANL